MESLLIRVPLDKMDIIVSFLNKLGIHFSHNDPDWIEPEQPGHTDVFADTFGMWSDTNITLESIRKKAWRRK